MSPPASPNPLDTPVTAWRRIGAERLAQLARLNIQSLGDLLLHRPRRYEDRRHFRPIAELQLGQPAITRGTVVALGIKRWRHGRKSVFELILDDGTGRLHCRWWNLPFMEKYFQQGTEVMIYGRPNSLKPRTIDHPETEAVDAGEETFVHLNPPVPVYPLTAASPQPWLRSLIWRTLQQHKAHIIEPYALTPSRFPGEPEGVRRTFRGPVGETRTGGMLGLPARADAIHMLHFPEVLADAEIARQRLALDEFIGLQVEIQTRRKRLQTSARALPCVGDNHLIRPFLDQLGFKLTGSQTKVLREIRRDLGGTQPMRRLLQGDVGAGKTVVAACAALMALESGYQVALMAPTEILAEQHFQTFSRWFRLLGVKARLRTGNRKSSNLEPQTSNLDPDAATQPASRNPPYPVLTIGTQALITAGFDLLNLGLVIIDEQHKFGVVQREMLVRKGSYPHLLVMTATPIPRTLGLTLYGDLDVSVIDQVPPGRGRIKTFVRAADKLAKVWEFIRGKLEQGRQAYVVYPRVEESDGGELKAVTKEWEKLRRELAPYAVGLLHGRLKSEEKEAVMNAFGGHRVHVLVATSIIEVGVDVPNATVMVIESAEQFGLAQLHQLRGRIGRGAHESYCVLVADIKTEEARQRLKVLEETTDGFRIAEEDLKLRGPGELLGREQSGMPSFRFGELARDVSLVERARELASQIIG